MATVSTSFTAVGVSGLLSVTVRDEIVSVALSGTYAATVQLEKSGPAGLAWERVGGPWSTANATVAFAHPHNEDRALYRLRCTSFTSGTVVSTVSDGDKVIDGSGPTPGFTRTQAGLTEHGNVTVDGASTLTGAVTASSTLDVTGAITSAAVSITTSGVGAKAGATVSAVESGDGVLHQTTLTCTATPITMADDAAQGQYGGVQVYDFPAGAICVLGAVMDGDFTAIEPWLDTWAGDTGLGTAVATDHNSVLATASDILNLSDIGAATALVAPIDAALPVATVLTESGARWHNGTNTAINMFLNVLADDDDGNTATTAAITFTGTIQFTWINLGTIAA